MVFRIFIVIFVASTFFTGMAFYFIVIYIIFASDVISFVPECITQLYLNQTIFIAVNNYTVFHVFMSGYTVVQYILYNPTPVLQK